MAIVDIGYTLIGLILLLVVPFIFHIFSFGKRLDLISIIASVLIGDFILMGVSLVFGLAGLFYGIPILLCSAVIAGFAGFIFRRQKLVLGKVRIKKEFAFLTVLFAVFLYVSQKLSGFLLLNDGIAKHLPWSRIITELHYIPGIYTQGIYYKIIYPHPLLYLHSSFMFSLTNIFSESIAAAIPIFFSAMTVLLLLVWAKEFEGKIGKFAYLFVIPALLVSYEFLLLSQAFYVEAPLLFFTTAAFYFFKRFLDNRKPVDMFLMITALSLASLAKVSGLVVAAVIFAVLLWKAANWEQRWKITYITAILFLPVLMWLARNYYYYNNPFYMSFSSIFSGPFNEFRRQLVVVFDPGVKIGYGGFALSFLWEFPVLVLSLAYMIINWKNKFVRYVLICFIASIAFVGISETYRILLRYQYQFFGILAVFGAVIISRIYSKIRIKARWRKPLIYGLTCLLMLAILVGFLFYPGIAARKQFIASEKQVAVFLQQREAGNDFLILADGTIAVEWYGNYKVITPSVNLYLKIFKNEEIDFSRSATYYYDVCRKYNIKYIYDSPAGAETEGNLKYSVNLMENVFRQIDKDSQHFELVYNRNNARLWQVKTG